jgi:hypothetical protein
VRKTNSPSPAQRRVQPRAQKAISYQFISYQLSVISSVPMTPRFFNVLVLGACGTNCHLGKFQMFINRCSDTCFQLMRSSKLRRTVSLCDGQRRRGMVLLLAQLWITAAPWSLALLLTTCPLSLRGQLSVPVPNNLYTVDGNSNSTLPFGVSSAFSLRYQQVYDGSQFMGEPQDGWITNLYAPVANGGWITDLFFRAEAHSCAFFATVSNVQIHLSTTQRPPDGLSPVFGENTGPDDTLVFSGSFTVGSESCMAGTEPFDPDHVALSTNFWYDPRAGNLLLDVTVFQGVSGLIPPFDAVDIDGDSVSRVYAGSVNATSGTTDTIGLVTLFGIAPIPALIAYTATNYIAIRWPTVPAGFVLQQSASLGSGALWQSLPGVGGTNPVYQEYHTSISSSGPRAFFRLAISAGH